MNHNMPTESKTFHFNYRGACEDLKNVKVLTQSNTLLSKKQGNFDRKSKDFSSMDYFSASILSSIITAIVEESEKKNAGIEEIEGTLEVQLDNPLSLLGVIGYEDEPKIAALNFKIYVYSEKEEADVIKFCQHALKKSPLYNTLKHAVHINIVFQLLL